MKLYKNGFKRLMDFTLATLAAFLLSPLILLTALVIRIKLGGPVLFTQDRPGLNGKIFKLYKFRSMTDARSEDGELLPDRERLTPFGKKLRSSSLDELPELINILKGDMSLIGPRPLLVQYLPLYNDHQNRRHEVRPGLSGLAQVNGRNAISWEKRFDLDVDYVNRISFALDLKILLLTLKKVVIKEGINSESSVTMEPFKGNKSL